MSRRFAVAVVAVTGVLAACSAGASQGAPTAAPATSVALAPAAAIKAAVTSTDAAGTAVLNMTINMAVAGKDIVIDMTGPMDLNGSGGDVTATMSGVGLGGGSNIKMREIIIGKLVYLKMNLAGLPDTWFKVDLSKTGAGSALPAGGIGAGDQLKQLQNLSQIKVVGSDTVGGVAATHYSGRVDFSKVSALIAKLGTGVDLSKITTGSSIPLDVWVDGKGRVIKLIEDMSLKVSGQTITMKVAMDLSNFGVPLKLTAPASAQDLSSMMGGAPTA